MRDTRPSMNPALAGGAPYLTVAAFVGWVVILCGTERRGICRNRSLAVGFGFRLSRMGLARSL